MTNNNMTNEEHKKYYILAYPVLERLVRDFIKATGQTMSNATVADFVDWVIEQT